MVLTTDMRHNKMAKGLKLFGVYILTIIHKFLDILNAYGHLATSYLTI